MADETETGKLQGNEQVGYKHPPVETRYNGSRPNKRNMRGVPPDAIRARHLIRRIAAELLKMPNSPEEITRIEAMLRVMFSSKAPADRQNILKALWPGLLKDEVDLTSGGEKITLNVVYQDKVKPQETDANDASTPPEGN